MRKHRIELTLDELKCISWCLHVCDKINYEVYDDNVQCSPAGAKDIIDEKIDEIEKNEINILKEWVAHTR
jgi:hypothetical protein